MSAPYVFTWTNPATPDVTVQPITKNTTSTSLTLTGQGSPNWGQDLQENLLWIMESFAAATAPHAAVTGQLWYNTVSKKLNVYDATLPSGARWVASATMATSSTAPATPVLGQQWFNPTGPTLSLWNGTAWIQIWPAAASSTAAPTNPVTGQQWFNPTGPILSVWDGTDWEQIFPVPPIPAMVNTKVAFVTEYNSMVDSINQIIGTPVGTTMATAYGWDQTLIPHETVASMTNAKWLSLLASLTKICTLLGISTAGINTTGFIYESGNLIPIGVITMMNQYTTTLAAVTALSSGTTRFQPIAGALESSSPATGITTRGGTSASWVGTIARDLTVVFADAPSMAGYFNAGGRVQFSSTLTNAVSTSEIAFAAFLASLGTIKFSVSGSVDSLNNTNVTGFYNLTSTATLIYSVTSSTFNFAVTAKISAPNTLVFHISYTDPGGVYGNTGTTVLTSSTSYVRPTAAYLSTPGIAWPTVSTTLLA